MQPIQMADPVDSVDPILEARGVTMRFGGLTAVDDVDLSVAAGEIVGLIGPNGAGKTTFFNCLTGLYTPTAGSITFRGQQLPPKPYRVAEAGISRTFQNIRLFPNMTALENVMVGRHCRTREGLLSAIGRGPRFRAAEREARETAEDLLSFLDLDKHAYSIARSLPYGDQRKLEIARALASDPGLLLLDEPTAGMNPRETTALRETIFKIRERGLSVIVIEHDMRFIFNLCDRVVVLARGKKLTEGRPDQVRADERVIATYLGTADQEASDVR
ncbi:ABC transporter ATP-binding protein [Catenulispora rubra]|uniref:ABC transporter ATP-binding protein n=1 Tax=Catenulispora rubra TaxID=280293 RepID=UPI001E5560F2|nr:ABC transporter ATP-binding protein [Catenulispora rubra]